MKNILLGLILLSTLSVFSQDCPVKIIIKNTQGYKDSVYFGLKDGATIGIDTVYGEHDISSIPYDTIDIRVIQRDSVHYKCLTNSFANTEPIYSPYNIESKIDYRNYNSSSFYSINFNYEILVKTNSTPLDVRGTFSCTNLGFWFYELRLLDSNCNLINEFYPNISDLDDVLLFTINSPGLYYILYSTMHEVGIEEKEKQVYSPINYDKESHLIRVDFRADNLNQKIEIFNSLGQIIFSKNTLNCQEIVNLNEYMNGVYLVRITDFKSRFQNTYKFIKN